MLLLKHAIGLLVDLLGRQTVDELSLRGSMRQPLFHEWSVELAAVDCLLLKRIAEPLNGLIKVVSG